ncbi:MAG: hybrid sensor histidine kinase/response regulator, partial [Bradyrhizobium sp.]|nr:hybrid sensor histidine kinase/response regulator [Bradyrhizobium sp.]
MSTLAPLGACLEWNQGLIWLNAVSDAIAACAFLTTAFVLGLFAWRRRRDLIPMFRVVFPVFALFV